MTFRHPGISRIEIEGDLERGQELLGRARAAIANLQNRMRLGGISVAADSYPIDDDAFLAVRISGGINIARLFVGEVAGVTVDQQDVAGVPDFVSGFVTDSTIETTTDLVSGEPVDYLEGFAPTQQTVETHPQLEPLTEQGMERLAVRPYPPFGYPSANDFGTIQFSQYTHITPTMYSGAMKRLIQALCGFGKLQPRRDPGGERILDSGEPIDVTRSASIYARVFDALEQGEVPEPTDYAKQVAEQGLQVRYDHRFWRTHGLYRAEDDQWWIVEINQSRGVHAMRLPLDPLTVPEYDEDGEIERWPFREAIEELEIEVEGEDEPRVVRDEDGLKVLDEFGGFPTGESFPGTPELFDAYVRAGEIIKLADTDDLSPFYRHSFYSTVMGWAFNENGNEAHNTGWRFDPDGIQSGVHYQLNIDIGELKDDDPAEGTAELAARARANASLLENGEKLRELLERKALRLSRFDVQRYRAMPDDIFIEELNRTEVDPIADGSADLRLIREGRLWCGHVNNAQAEQIKFYEPLLGYLLSHDFRPARNALRFQRTACDTTMHVFFDGDEFKWVRYFVTDRASSPETRETDDFDDCSWIGTFTQLTEYGERQVTSGFYTSDFDDRQELPGGEVKRVYHREYLGPASIAVGDDPADIRRNYATRSHRFRHNNIVEQTTGERVEIGVAVPQNIREAYSIGVMHYRESYSRTSSWSYESRSDPYFYEGWRCIVSTAGFATWPADMQECGPGCDTRRGVPISPGNPRIARYEGYDPYRCSEYIDSGPWAAKCDNLDSLVYNIPAPPLPADESENIPRKADYVVRYVCAGAPRNKATVNAKLEDATWAVSKYNIPSPDEFGFVQNMRAAANSFGDTESAVYMRAIDNQVYSDRPDDESEIYGPYKQDFIVPSIVYIGVI